MGVSDEHDEHDEHDDGIDPGQSSTCVFREAGCGWQSYRFRIWHSPSRLTISKGYATEEQARAELQRRIAKSSKNLTGV